MPRAKAETSKTIEITETLPGQGTLTIDTTPVKGEVFVDGASWGIAPQSRSLNPGNYTVSFGMVEGYVTPIPQTATVTEGQTTTITGTYKVILAYWWLFFIVAPLATGTALIATSTKKK